MKIRTLLLSLLGVMISEHSLSATAALIAHWKFDEAGGATAADSAGAFTGTLAGSASFVGGGISGNAIDLNEATGDMVNMGNVLGFAGAGNFTASSWINTTTIDDDTLYLGKHRGGLVAGWFLALNMSAGYGQPNKAYFYNTDPQTGVPITTSSVNNGQWRHIVAVYDSTLGVQSIFVDGVFEDSRVIGNVTAGNTADFIVGGFSSSGVPTATYTGLIDDVQIYDEALDANEVAFLFANPGSPVPLPPAFLLMLSGLAFVTRKRAH